MNILGAQINVVIGDFRGNFDKIRRQILGTAPHFDFLVFPELSLTGYPPNDLLLREGFVTEQLFYVEKIRELSKSKPGLNIVLGVVTHNTKKGKPFQNSLIVFREGAEVLRYHKQLLPTYNVFDEMRYFEPGGSDQRNTLLWKEEMVGFLICEDAWNDDEEHALYETNPIKSCRRNQVNTLITINASPSHILKAQERYAMYEALAKKYDMNIFYLNQVGGHDSLIFDGFSFYVSSWSQKVQQVALGYQEDTLDTSDLSHNKGIEHRMESKEESIFEHLRLGVKDYVGKNGFKSVVVGSSGGIDSAVVIALAVAAVGAANVYAITMPSKFSSEGSVDDSVELCNRLGVKLYTRPIGDEVTASIAAFTKAFGEAPSRLTIENEQARIRGRILMEFSNHFNALVLSTGNKSEMSVGYATIYGDMCGGLAVIADLYKMEVYALAEWLNMNYFNNGVGAGPEYYGIPDAIVSKAPSAELWEGQKDTDSLPPYPILDALLKLYIERDYLTEEEVNGCQETIKGMTIKEIEKYLKMVDRAEFKRQQAALILRVHKRAFGAGRVLPITQKYSPNYKNVL